MLVITVVPICCCLALSLHCVAVCTLLRGHVVLALLTRTGDSFLPRVASAFL